MSFKEIVNKEKEDLLANKRPYETAAFIIFSVLFLQQLTVLLYRLYDFFRDRSESLTNFAIFNTGSTTAPNFFVRLVAIDSTKILFVLLAFAALVFWYFLVYLLVFRYCKRHGYAKWTWTTLIVFGPTMLFIPPYMFYVVYVFRPYFFRFIKTVIEEYHAYDPTVPFPEEEEEITVEDQTESNE